MPPRKGHYYDEDDFYDDGYADEEDYDDEYEQYAAPAAPAPKSPKPPTKVCCQRPRGYHAVPYHYTSKSHATHMLQSRQPAATGSNTTSTSKQLNKQLNKLSLGTIASDTKESSTGAAHCVPQGMMRVLVQKTSNSQRKKAMHPFCIDFATSLLEQGTSSSAKAASTCTSRPWAEYVSPPTLADACAQAARAERDVQNKPIIHLVVLGHVDAGKSTLMGKLLHQLGKVDSRTVHKHEKEVCVVGVGIA